MIWKNCHGVDHIRPITGELFRLVESQEQVATLGYVDTLSEQAVLEELLDNVKPPVPDNCTHLDYLLFTPFRYPPLTWGSRFGKTYEPSLFYGGCSIAATLAEAAYYRLLHLTSMLGTPPKSSLRSAHSIFSVHYATGRGVLLQYFPFDNYQAQLAHRSSYSAAQGLGADMRKANIEAFEYTSARALNKQNCVALFTPAAFIENKPVSLEHWLCETTPEGVAFKKTGAKLPHYFQVKQFMVDGNLPLPA